jgi:glutaredoxin 3
MTSIGVPHHEVTVYSTGWCPYCDRAKGLLKRKGVAYREIDVDHAPDQREVMEQRSGRMTVPQIFIGDQHVGGSDDLHALERAGRLDALLGR